MAELSEITTNFVIRKVMKGQSATVQKNFAAPNGSDWHTGRVLSFDNKTGFYTVGYKDGDREQINCA